MLNHLVIGVNDLERAYGFYDAVLGQLGFARYRAFETRCVYDRPDGGRVIVGKPGNGDPATVGNGSMPCFSVATRAAVDAFHATALLGGGTDDGPPGERIKVVPPMYIAYVRDPDGNKLAACCRV